MPLTSDQQKEMSPCIYTNFDYIYLHVFQARSDGDAHFLQSDAYFRVTRVKNFHVHDDFVAFYVFSVNLNQIIELGEFPATILWL